MFAYYCSSFVVGVCDSLFDLFSKSKYEQYAYQQRTPFSTRRCTMVVLLLNTRDALARKNIEVVVLAEDGR